jgi:hypothetical protein
LGLLQGRSPFHPNSVLSFSGASREHLTVAERELEGALSELKVAERADKKMISERLELAFEKLAAGRRNLEAILHEEP